MYLGIVDFWVFLAFALCILSALLCVAYGAWRWNKDGNGVAPEDVAWAKEEDALKEEM